MAFGRTPDASKIGTCSPLQEPAVSSPNNDVRVSAYVSKEVRDTLAVISERTGVTLSVYIRRFLSELAKSGGAASSFSQPK